MRISWLDVFTDRPFAGNQLAVVPDGDGLSEEQMQTLARELGISETVYALHGGRRIRIFTPAQELPLAGHPTVGCAIGLARLGMIPGEGRWEFTTGVGQTPVDLSDGTAFMTQAEPELGLEHDLAAVVAELRAIKSLLAADSAELWTADDLARALSVSTPTIFRMRSAGALPAPVRLGTQIVRWRRTAIIAWLDGLKPEK